MAKTRFAATLKRTREELEGLRAERAEIEAHIAKLEQVEKAMSAVIGGLGENGTLFVIGASADPIEAPPGLLLRGRRSIKGWYSGTSIDSEDTVAFSVLTGVRSMNEVFPLEAAPQAYARMMSGQARFRVVLTTGN